MKPGAVEVPVNQRLKLPANIYGAATGSLKVKDAGSFCQLHISREREMNQIHGEPALKGDRYHADRK